MWRLRYWRRREIRWTRRFKNASDLRIHSLGGSKISACRLKPWRDSLKTWEKISSEAREMMTWHNCPRLTLQTTWSSSLTSWAWVPWGSWTKTSVKAAVAAANKISHRIRNWIYQVEIAKTITINLAPPNLRSRRHRAPVILRYYHHRMASRSRSQAPPKRKGRQLKDRSTSLICRLMMMLTSWTLGERRSSRITNAILEKSQVHPRCRPSHLIRRTKLWPMS